MSGAIGPLVPARLRTGDDLMDDGRDWALGVQMREMEIDQRLLLGRDFGTEARAHQLLACTSEIAAECRIDEGDAAIWPMSPDHLSLVFDDGTVESLLAACRFGGIPTLIIMLEAIKR